jgi:predicted AlkP superfamily pyrophosphatase or phosphodiesterase
MQRKMVVILIDALGWEVVRMHEFCKGILPFQTPAETVLGYSSAAIPSLLTGEPPSEHGIWSMYRHDPEGSPFRSLRFLPRLPFSVECRIRNVLKRRLDRKGLARAYYDLYLIPPRILSRFDLAQKGDPYSADGLENGIFARLQSERIRYKVWDYRSREEDNFGELLEALAGDARLLFLYTAELDSLMHRLGLEHDEVRRKLAYYEEAIKEIVEKAGRLSLDLDLFVFSDHGMTPVTGEVDLWGGMERSHLRIGKGLTAFFDSTMARFWADEGHRSLLADFLSGFPGGRILGTEELEKLGCRFEDGSYGEVIFLADPGVMIVPSFMGRERLAAMHGYHPDDPFSKACFLSLEEQGDAPRSILQFKDFLLARLQ